MKRRNSRLEMFYSTKAGQSALKANQPPERSQFMKELVYAIGSIWLCGFDHERPGKYVKPLIKAIRWPFSERITASIFLATLVSLAVCAIGEPPISDHSHDAPHHRSRVCAVLNGKPDCERSESFYEKADAAKKGTKATPRTKKVVKPNLPVCIYDKGFNLISGTEGYYCPDPEP